MGDDQPELTSTLESAKQMPPTTLLRRRSRFWFIAVIAFAAIAGCSQSTQPATVVSGVVLSVSSDEIPAVFREDQRGEETGGVPLENAEIVITGPFGNHHVHTDEQGRFRIELGEAPDGTRVDFMATGPGHDGFRIRGWGVGGPEDVLEYGPTDIEIRLPRQLPCPPARPADTGDDAKPS